MEGWYERDGNKFYKSSFEPGWIRKWVPRERFGVLDVGAYDGGDSLLIKLEYPEADIIAVEACPERVKELCKIEKYGVKVVHSAVLDKPGSILFNQCTYGGQYISGSIFKASGVMRERHPDFKFSNSIVPSKTIEEIWAEHGTEELQVLHMDIEGAELLALKGLGIFRPKLICAEVGNGKLYENAPTPAEINSFINTLGYKLERTLGCDNLYVYEK